VKITQNFTFRLNKKSIGFFFTLRRIHTFTAGLKLLVLFNQKIA